MLRRSLPRTFHGIWVPALIWDHPDLTPVETLLAIEHANVPPDTQVEYFASRYHITRAKVRAVFDKLTSLHLISGTSSQIYASRTRAGTPPRALRSLIPSLSERNSERDAQTRRVCSEDDENAKSSGLEMPVKYQDLSRQVLEIQQRNRPKAIKDITDRKVMEGAITIDRLVRIDGHDFETEVKPVILWAVDDDEFWSNQVMGCARLRNKRNRDSETKFTNIMSSFLFRGPKDAQEAAATEHNIRMAMGKVGRNFWDAYTTKSNDQSKAKEIAQLLAEVQSYYDTLPVKRCAAIRHWLPTGYGLVTEYAKYIEHVYRGPISNLKAIRVDGPVWGHFVRHLQSEIGVELRTGKPIA